MYGDFASVTSMLNGFYITSRPPNHQCFIFQLWSSVIFVESPTPRNQQRCGAPKYNPTKKQIQCSGAPHLNNDCCIDFLQIETVRYTLKLCSAQSPYYAGLETRHSAEPFAFLGYAKLSWLLTRRSEGHFAEPFTFYSLSRERL